MVAERKIMTCTMSDSLEVNIMFENWISSSKPLDSMVEFPQTRSKKIKSKKTKNDMSLNAVITETPPLPTKSPQAQVLLTNVINNYPPSVAVGLPPPNLLSLASFFETIMISTVDDSPKNNQEVVVKIKEPKEKPPPIQHHHNHHHETSSSNKHKLPNGYRQEQHGHKIHPPPPVLPRNNHSHGNIHPNHHPINPNYHHDIIHPNDPQTHYSNMYHEHYYDVDIGHHGH